MIDESSVFTKDLRHCGQCRIGRTSLKMSSANEEEIFTGLELIEDKRALQIQCSEGQYYRDILKRTEKAKNVDKISPSVNRYNSNFCEFYL